MHEVSHDPLFTAELIRAWGEVSEVLLLIVSALLFGLRVPWSAAAGAFLQGKVLVKSW